MSLVTTRRVRLSMSLPMAKALGSYLKKCLAESSNQTAAKAADNLAAAILVAEEGHAEPDAESLVAEANRLLRKAQEVCKHVRWKRQEDAGGIMPYYWTCQTCGHETYRPPAAVEVEKGVA